MMCEPHRIYAFSEESGEGEFVVISDLPVSDVVAEYSLGSRFQLDNVREIVEDATSLPCDCRLRRAV